MRTGTGEVVQTLSHAFTNITAQVARIPIEAIPDHDIGIITIITGVAHITQISHTGVTAIDLTMTLHIDHTANHQHTEANHITLEMGACPAQDHHTNLHNETHIDHSCTPVDHGANHITRRTPE